MSCMENTTLRHQSTGSFLLSALPEEVLERLAPHLARVALPVGRVLNEAGTSPRDAYFPIDCIVSQLYVMEDGSSAEVALIGREGMVGVSLLLGPEMSACQSSVQSAGQAFRLPAQCLRSEFIRGGAQMQVLLRYIQFFMAQMAQSAACNRHGTLEQRLCRLLLLSLDRQPGSELLLTHELIANALGVGRAGVTEAAGRLQHEGAIHYRRGHISVLDRPVLERRACECYEADRREAERLLRSVYAVRRDEIGAAASPSRPLVHPFPPAGRSLPAAVHFSG
jgi:CRP-like cAMP-binding protein